jgi:hypothetical protein
VRTIFETEKEILKGKVRSHCIVKVKKMVQMKHDEGAGIHRKT